MQKLCATVLMVVCLSLMVTDATANRPAPPEPPVEEPAPELSLAVLVDYGAERSKLIIPEKCLAQDASHQKNSAISNPRTLVAGIALSMAIGGVFLLRRSQKLGNTAMMVAVVGILSLGVAGYAWANVPEPPELRPVPEPLPIFSVGDISLDVEVVREGEEIQLILTEQDLNKLKKTEDNATPVP